MKLASASIKDFKRFTDLSVLELPENARMIVLVGPNGSGKTSLFEAFNYWQSQVRGPNFDATYHMKMGGAAVTHWQHMMQRIQLKFHGVVHDPRDVDEHRRKVFYLRSAYRHEADFTLDNLSRSQEILADSNRPVMLINTETRVSDNYRRIVAASIDSLYDPAKKKSTAEEITEEIIGRVRAAMLRVFEDAELVGPGKPLEGGSFYFKKGTSSNYHYKNLSGGEKAAFDLLLDFVVKVQAFDNTIFCIDEPELHLHTRLQGRLLDELYSQTSGQSQLWISTHSIGMTRRAMELHRSDPTKVVFLDFRDRNFDLPVILKPAVVNSQFWKGMFSTALDDLAELIAPSSIIFCEGRKETKAKQRTPTFDASVYRAIFAESHPDTDFVPLGGAGEVTKDAALIQGVMANMLPKTKMWTVFDRDDRSPQEIADAQKAGNQVLSRRDLESFLWDDEILEKLANLSGKSSELAGIVAEKQRLIALLPSQNMPVNDVKAIVGPLYNFVRIKLQLVNCGNSAVEFARATLAPLVTRETKVFSELKACVFPK